MSTFSEKLEKLEVEFARAKSEKDEALGRLRVLENKLARDLNSDGIFDTIDEYEEAFARMSAIEAEIADLKIAERRSESPTNEWRVVRRRPGHRSHTRVLVPLA